MWARLRVAGIRTSKTRVLRLMRQPQPVRGELHRRTITTNHPNRMWGIDATATVTLDDCQVTLVAAVYHCTAECVRIHAVKRAAGLEALELLRQGLHRHDGGFQAGAAQGFQLWYDHASLFMSDDFQNELAFLGTESSLAFVREPEGADFIERFFRALKEQMLWVSYFQSVQKLVRALEVLRTLYNQHWLIEPLGFELPVQARRRLALQPAA